MGQSKGLILLIDDDPAVNQFHEAIIQQLIPEGKIFTFVNGKEALQFLTDQPSSQLSPSVLVFLDLNMPEFSGWDFIRELKTHPEEILNLLKLFVVSSLPKPGDQLEINAEPLIIDWLEKPLSKGIFLEVINNL